MTSRAGTSTRKLTRTPQGFSIYVLGGHNGTTQQQTLIPQAEHDRYDAHPRQSAPVAQSRPRKLTKTSPDARTDASSRMGHSYAQHQDDRHYVVAEAPRMPRRSSSTSAEGRRHGTPSHPSAPAAIDHRGSPYDYPTTTTRTSAQTPNSHSGIPAYPFPVAEAQAYSAQPTQNTVYTSSSGVTYVQHAPQPTAYHHAPASTYPTQNGASQVYPSTPSPPYAMPMTNAQAAQSHAPYDGDVRSREPSPARGRPPLRRSDPYDTAPPPTPHMPSRPPSRRDSGERRMSESVAPGAPRLSNAQPIPPPVARVDSQQLYRRSGRRDSSGSWSGDKSVRDSFVLEQLEEGTAKPYPYAGVARGYSTLPDAQYAAQQYRAEPPRYDTTTPEFDERLVGFPGSPGSASSSGSDFDMPSTPPPLHIDTNSRSVRWNANLHLPSPVHREKRKGWFNVRGDQLWTNSGAYKPPNPGEEYPEDLRAYPDVGHGYMNEHGVRIDMQHCRVPAFPLRSALKRRDS